MKAKKIKAEAKRKQAALEDDEEEAEEIDILPALNQLPPEQLQALMQEALKQAGVNVPPGAAKKAQGKANNAGVPLDGGQKAHDLVPGNVQAEADCLLDLCLTGTQKKAKNGVENLIRDIARNHLFRIVKFIPNPEAQAIAMKKVHKWLNFWLCRATA